MTRPSLSRAVLVVALVLLASACGPSRDEIDLGYAAEAGDMAEVERLLDGGTDPNAYTEGGFTAVLNAAAAGNRRTLGMLLDAGGDARLETKRGTSALALVAYTSGDVEMGRMLIGHGADPCVDAGGYVGELGSVSTLRDLAEYSNNAEFAEFIEEAQEVCPEQ